MNRFDLESTAPQRRAMALLSFMRDATVISSEMLTTLPDWGQELALAEYIFSCSPKLPELRERHTSLSPLSQEMLLLLPPPSGKLPIPKSAAALFPYEIDDKAGVSLIFLIANGGKECRVHCSPPSAQILEPISLPATGYDLFLFSSHDRPIGGRSWECAFYLALRAFSEPLTLRDNLAKEWILTGAFDRKSEKITPVKFGTKEQLKTQRRWLVPIGINTGALSENQRTEVPNLTHALRALHGQTFNKSMDDIIPNYSILFSFVSKGARHVIKGLPILFPHIMKVHLFYSSDKTESETPSEEVLHFLQEEYGLCCTRSCISSNDLTAIEEELRKTLQGLTEEESRSILFHGTCGNFLQKAGALMLLRSQEIKSPIDFIYRDQGTQEMLEFHRIFGKGESLLTAKFCENQFPFLSPVEKERAQTLFTMR